MTSSEKTILKELKELCSTLKQKGEFPPYMTFAQAEKFLGLKGDKDHRAVKRFLDEQQIPVNSFSAGKKLVNRERLEAALEENLQYLRTS